MWTEEEYFGEPKLIGICANCGEELYLGDEEVVYDSHGDLFCCDTCALNYYGVKEYTGE